MLIYKKFKKPKYNGESIVDGLKQSVYGKRHKWPSNKKLFYDVGTLAEIAETNGLSYEDPREAHITMLGLLKKGKLRKSPTHIKSDEDKRFRELMYSAFWEWRMSHEDMDKVEAVYEEHGYNAAVEIRAGLIRAKYSGGSPNHD